MYIKKIRFVVSLCIALATLSLFGLQQFNNVQRMAVIDNQSIPPSEPTIAENNPGTADDEQQTEEPEVKIAVKENTAKPTIEPETKKVLDANLTFDESYDEQAYYALATPNDPQYPQWYTTIINAPQGWDVTTGTSDTSVAVIDTGYALDHEDLEASWLENPGETGNTQDGDACWNGAPEDKATNDCDDDGNALVDDWRGWDFANGDNTPQAGEDDPLGATHGTKVAGLVGARANNSLGVASVNWGVRILPLQGLYDEGVGYSSDIAAAIVYAVERGVDVINLSLGGATPDPIILAAIQYADSNNVVVIAASGNCGDEQSSPECTGYPSPGGMSYPARYSEVIAVGATNSSDQVASFSSWGAELDIVAPGSGTIKSPSWSAGNQTSLYSDTSFGTSFAAPIVSSLAGLIKSEFPELDTDEVLALLRKGADRPAGMGGEGRTDLYGYGRINVYNTLLQIDQYREELTKSGGLGGTVSLDDTTPPLITTNSGHSEGSPVGSDDVITYCVTTPYTLCTLNLNKTGSSTVSFGTKLTNTQGIATWRWSAGDVSEAGTWTATTTANSLISGDELLIIQ